MENAAKRSLLLVLPLVLPCNSAFSQNVVANHDFDSGIGAWTGNPAYTAFDPTRNQVGVQGSGTIEVTNSVGNGITISAWQCVTSNFAAGQYDFGGWILLPTGQSGMGAAGVAVSFYGTTDCTGNSIAFQNAFALPSDAWTLYASQIAAPAGAASALVDLRVDTSPNAIPPVTAWFDGIRLGPTPTTPVELQSFDVD